MSTDWKEGRLLLPLPSFSPDSLAQAVHSKASVFACDTALLGISTNFGAGDLNPSPLSQTPLVLRSLGRLWGPPLPKERSLFSECSSSLCFSPSYDT